MTSTQSLRPDSRIIRNDEIASGEIDGELVALDIDRGECFGLDGVGAAIWEMAASQITVDALTDRLVEDYAVDRDRCLAEILPFLEELADVGMIRIVAA